eukprot:521246-Alexandrium_andersonii.AAC.1
MDRPGKACWLYAQALLVVIAASAVDKLQTPWPSSGWTSPARGSLPCGLPPRSIAAEEARASC